MAPRNTPNRLEVSAVNPDPLELAIAVVEGLWDHFRAHDPANLGAAQMQTIVGLLRDAWDSILLGGQEADARGRIIGRLYMMIVEEQRDAGGEANAKEAPVEEGR